MRLPTLRAGTRILGSFSILVFLIACGSALAFWRIATGDTIASDLVHDKLAKQQLTSDLLGVVRLNSLRALSVAQSDSLELSDLYKEQLAAGEKQAADIEAALLALPMSWTEKALASEAGARKVAATAIRTEVFRAKDMGRTMEVEELVGTKLQPSLKRYTDSLEKLLAWQSAQARALAEQSATASAISRTLLATMGLAAVAAGMLLAWHLTRSIVAPLQQAVALAEQVAAGDLRASIHHERSDEIGRLFDALNRMTASMSSTLGKVVKGAAAVDEASGDIAAGNRDLARRTERQALSLRETAQAMDGLTAMVHETSERTREADQLARSASSVAAEGGAVVSDMAGKMVAIRASARRISDITSVIDGIAFQTNILALNAAVEAARAGQEGRGFAVVAGEVRQLAQRCAAAAKDIKHLIGHSNHEIDAGMAMAGTAAQTMHAIVDGVQRVTVILGDIHAAAERQSQGIVQVGSAVAEMDSVTRQNAALVEQAASAAAAMRNQAHELAGLVATFRVHGSGAAQVSYLAPRTVEYPQQALAA
ncbi:MAG TPA: methyl-accepting chemotaxis protein [Telluria sp.]|nr:methyl-accepting chemotaxis protein [Telluria sp.]